MELNSLSKRISSQLEELNLSKRSKDGQRDLIPSERYEVIQTEAQLNLWCEEILKLKFFAIDTETTSLDTLYAELVGISICIGFGKACYIPITHKTDNPEYKDLRHLYKDFSSVWSLKLKSRL